MPASRQRSGPRQKPRVTAAARASFPRVRWLFATFFISINLLLSSYFLDSVPSPNPTSRILPVLTLYEEGTYAIDTYEKQTMDKSFINGHYYSDKAPLSTWIVLPFYGLLKLSGIVARGTDPSGWRHVVLLGDVLCGSVPFAVLLWFVFGRVIVDAPRVNPVLFTMLPLYGSCIFAYSGVFMSHVLAAALLCGSYSLLTRGRYSALCGLLLGLAVLAEFPTALALPIWIVVIARADRRRLVPFVLGGLPCAAALLWYDHAITGSYFRLPYEFIADSNFAAMRTFFGVSLPQPEAMWGLLFGTYRGLFFYAPGLIAIGLAYIVHRRTLIVRRDLKTPLAVLAILYLALISSYFVWWGGWAYGPRHLIPVAALLFYEGVPLVARTGLFNGLLFLLSSCGVAMVWLAKSTALYLMPEPYPNPVFDLALPSFTRGRLRPDALPTQLFHLDPGPAAWLWLALFVAGAAVLHRMHGRGA